MPLTWLEINSAAILYNLKELRRLAGKKTILMPVVKSNAYGHGFLGVAKILDKSREADRLCVANSDEALSLVEAGIKKPVMILSFFDLDEKTLLTLSKKQIIFTLYTLEQAKILNKIGERVNKKIKVHLKIDCGTSRVGILPNEIKKFAVIIKKFKYLEIEGAFSHFSSSETDGGVTGRQYKIFEKALAELREMEINPPIRHMACTAASTLYKFKELNAIRPGIGLYGLYPADSLAKKIKLQPALSWFTKIIQVKTVSKGAKVGYGGSFTAKHQTQLAVLPIGYFDGYDRRLSNKAFVLIKGKKCPVIGRVCMNLTMVDATSAGKISAGDKVTLIGPGVTADNLADIVGTINYEVVTRINPLLPRIFIVR